MHQVCDTAESACAAAAVAIATVLRDAVTRRGVATLALSGGSTPVPMFDALSEQELPWTSVHIFQSDERCAPRGSAERNLTQVEQHLLSRVHAKPVVHAMPVDGAGDVAAAASAYAREIAAVAGSGMLDVVHLGLGSDGHTASLVPGDPVLEIVDRDVAITAPYRGLRRMTLTYPLLSRARSIVWLVTGSTKADAMARLIAGDTAMPAGRVARDHAVVFADRAAAFLTASSEGTP
jgi:6-phosphogluconolactonase